MSLVTIVILDEVELSKTMKQLSKNKVEVLYTAGYPSFRLETKGMKAPIKKKVVDIVGKIKCDFVASAGYTDEFDYVKSENDLSPRDTKLKLLLSVMFKSKPFRIAVN